MFFACLIGCGGPAKRAATPSASPAPGASAGPAEALQAGDAHAREYEKLGLKPPPYTGPAGDEKALSVYYKDVVGPWLKSSLVRARELDVKTVNLGFWERPVAARAASIYYLSLIETLRGLPVPSSFQDRELREAYVGSLEDWMAPLKHYARMSGLMALEGYEQFPTGRDATVVGPLFDSLSATVGGARLKSLQTELLLPADAAGCESVMCVPNCETKKNPVNCPQPQPACTCQLLRHAMQYWSGASYDQIVATGANSKDASLRFYAALAQTLAHGPRSLRQYFDAGSPSELDLRHVEPLLAYAASGSPHAGIALYDAAMLKVLSPPAKPPAGYFDEAAALFKKAAEKDPSLKEKAQLEEAHARALGKAQAAVVAP